MRPLTSVMVDSDSHAAGAIGIRSEASRRTAAMERIEAATARHNVEFRIMRRELYHMRCGRADESALLARALARGLPRTLARRLARYFAALFACLTQTDGNRLFAARDAFARSPALQRALFLAAHCRLDIL